MESKLKMNSANGIKLECQLKLFLKLFLFLKRKFIQQFIIPMQKYIKNKKPKQSN